nr:39S ribosomal protein L34, mitochondrial [Onthophagus taurus]
MSLLNRVFNLTVNAASRISPISQINPSPGGLFTVSVRNVIRCHFPRPSERKRVKRHGFLKRMQTFGGQRVLMRRILKGKHVYSH